MKTFRFNEKIMGYELFIDDEWVPIKLIEDEIDYEPSTSPVDEDVKKAG